MEYPDSSLLARIIGMLSIFVIIVSIFTFCLETTPDYREIIDKGDGKGGNVTSIPPDKVPFVKAVKYIEIIR